MCICLFKRVIFIEFGEWVFNKEKDERVLMRLMVVCRKSL